MTDPPLTERTTVAIVGGGLVGGALALLLARQGLAVTVVEPQSRETQLHELEPATTVHGFEPRVSALTEGTRQLLEDLGIWSEVEARRCCPYREMRVWDAEGTGSIHFDAAELQLSRLGSIVENRIVLGALARAMVAEPNLTWLDGEYVRHWRPTGAGSAVMLSDGRWLEARLVVGADGANSRIRQWAGLATREWDYDQQAIVCTARTEYCHQRTAWQRFMTTGPVAYLPLANEESSDRFVSIVWSQDVGESARLMNLDEGAFAGELAAALEWTLGAVEAVSTRHALPLRQRHAREYTRPGVVLVGDAAHTIHPLAGQGVNLGFADAAVLADEIRLAMERGLEPSHSSALQRYQRRRKVENLSLMAAMEGFKQLFARDELPLRWLRNTGMRWLDGQAGIKNRIAAEAMGSRYPLPRFPRPVPIEAD